MLRKIDFPGDIPVTNMLLAKIACNTACYGKYDFCETLANEDFSTVINRIDNNAVLFATSKADFDEISAYLYFKNILTIFTEPSIVQKLGYKLNTSGIVMKYSGEQIFTDYKQEINPDYKFIYNSLINNEFALPDYDNFLSDLSFRVNHSFARIISNENGVAFTGWETKNTSIISCISVNKKGIGTGSKLLNALVSLLLTEEKQIYLYREKNKNEKFYKNNGFINCGEFATGGKI